MSSTAMIFCFTASTFIPQASPSLQTRGGAREYPTAPFAKAWCLYTHEHRTERVTGSEGRKGVNGIGGGIGVGGGNEDGNGVGGGNGNGNSDGDWDGAGTGTEVEANEGTQDGSGDGSGDENEGSNGDGNGNEDGNGDGNEDGIGESGGEAKKRKKPHMSSRRDQVLSFRTHHPLCKQ